ncbi:MAG: hypothetical protein ACRD5G_03005 [Candidatus Acidiferrales bacterium]
MQTPDVEILPAGMTEMQIGFDFLQDVDFPASGLSGDLTNVGVLRTRTALGRRVELQMEVGLQHFLSVKRQVAGPIPVILTGPNSTRGLGDFTFFTKVRLWGEGRRRPALGFRFGYQIPTSDQTRGIGLNTTNVFSEIILQKHVGKLNLYGTAGLAILQAPTATFTQNDVLTYGVAFALPLRHRLTLLGEVNGRYSTRDMSPRLVGTESRSQARMGVRIAAGGLVWDVAGIKGLTGRDATGGFTFGVSKRLRLFD